MRKEYGMKYLQINMFVACILHINIIFTSNLEMQNDDMNQDFIFYQGVEEFNNIKNFLDEIDIQKHEMNMQKLMIEVPIILDSLTTTRWDLHDQIIVLESDLNKMQENIDDNNFFMINMSETPEEELALHNKIALLTEKMQLMNAEIILLTEQIKQCENQEKKYVKILSTVYE